MKTNNTVLHDAETGIVTILVVRRDGTSHKVLMDGWFWAMFPELNIFVKPMRHGLNKFYPATNFEGKFYYLHQLVGSVWLEIAATRKNNDRTEIDHKNRNPLDCRIGNLRAANRSEQQKNRDKYSMKKKTNPPLQALAA